MVIISFALMFHSILKKSLNLYTSSELYETSERDEIRGPESVVIDEGPEVICPRC